MGLKNGLFKIEINCLWFEYQKDMLGFSVRDCPEYVGIVRVLFTCCQM